MPLTSVLWGLWVIPLLGFQQLLVSAGSLATLCRPNERYLACGSCQKTCRDPAPVCTAVCRTGCYCSEDMVRNDTGDCVPVSECPPMLVIDLEASEPEICPTNEEYRSCESCNRTCDDPNPFCPSQCARGCFCVGNLLRDKDGKCVQPSLCSNSIKMSENVNPSLPPPYQLSCGPHQEYRPCQQCERTCSSQYPVCSNNKTCNAGCFCKDGWVKSPSGMCVRPEECPRAEISHSSDHEVSIEDCAPEEVYLSCGWCEPSCSDPKPVCPKGVCTRGCLCRPPLLRHHNGHCVEPTACTPQRCADPNEEYVCRYGCETRCDRHICTRRPRKCQLGCHCKFGLLRDSNGKCVPIDKCSKTSNNLQDVYANVHPRKGPKSSSPIFALSVFGPIKIGKTSYFVNPNISQAVDPRQDKLFKSPVFDTNRSKTTTPSMSVSPIDDYRRSNPKKFARIGSSANPSIVFFERYTMDPFRGAFDAKTFESSNMEERKLGEPSKAEISSSELERTTDHKDFTKDPGVTDPVFFDLGISKESNNGKVLNDTSIAFFGKFVNDLMKQMIAPFTSVNYTTATLL